MALGYCDVFLAWLLNVSRRAFGPTFPLVSWSGSLGLGLVLLVPRILVLYLLVWSLVLSLSFSLGPWGIP